MYTTRDSQLGRSDHARLGLFYMLIGVGGPLSIAVPNLLTGLSTVNELINQLSLSLALFSLTSLVIGGVVLAVVIRAAVRPVDAGDADRRWFLLRSVIIVWGILHNLGFALILHWDAPFIYDAVGLVLVSLFSGAVGLFFAIILISGSGNDIERAAAVHLANNDQRTISKQLTYTGLTSKLFLNISLSITAFLFGGIGVSLYGVYAGNSVGYALSRAAMVAVPFLLLTFLLVLLLRRVFSQPLEQGITPIQALQHKDLTQNLPIVSRDEIGVVFTALSAFVESLRGSIGEASRLTHQNLDRSVDLDARVEEQNQALAGVQESIQDISSQLQKLSQGVENSAGASEEITRTIESLDNQISSQSDMLMEALSAAEEMASAVGNVANVSRQRRDSAQQLRTTAGESRRQLEGALSAMHEVTTEVDELMGINQMIAKVAAQTNLLAMNAAIEAAHAGDAGRGFSVVAEEIRSLASSSSQHSQKTTGFLKHMVESISAANDAVEQLRSSFDEVDTETSGAVQSLEEIAGAAAEMTEGAQQIRRQMTSLSEVNHTITEGSTEMKTGMQEITAATHNSREASGEVEGSLRTIHQRAAELAKAASVIGDASESLRQEARQLYDQLDEFTI